MFFRKPKRATCAVCGKAIEPTERRFVDKNRITKQARHAHLACHQTETVRRQPPA